VNVDLVFFTGIVSLSSDGSPCLWLCGLVFLVFVVPAEDLNSVSEVGPDDGPHLSSPREDALGGHFSVVWVAWE